MLDGPPHARTHARPNDDEEEDAKQGEHGGGSSSGQYEGKRDRAE